ncbi:MAG TPA: HesB/YadR/YfhF-family protein [Solirubrobacteraceae bacterium]
MLTLTDKAIDVIDEILSDPAIPRGAGVRIGPADGATVPAGEFMVTIAEVPAITDEVIEDRGARVFVDEEAAGFLDDKLLDAESGEKEVRFSVTSQQE